MYHSAICDAAHRKGRFLETTSVLLHHYNIGQCLPMFIIYIMYTIMRTIRLRPTFTVLQYIKIKVFWWPTPRNSQNNKENGKHWLYYHDYKIRYMQLLKSPPFNILHQIWWALFCCTLGLVVRPTSSLQSLLYLSFVHDHLSVPVAHTLHDKHICIV